MHAAPDPVDWPWKKSTRSGASGCVEVAVTPHVVGVRDTKDPGPMLRVAPGAWRSFVESVREGRFDRT